MDWRGKPSTPFLADLGFRLFSFSSGTHHQTFTLQRLTKMTAIHAMRFFRDLYAKLKARQKSAQCGNGCET